MFQVLKKMKAAAPGLIPSDCDALHTGAHYACLFMIYKGVFNGQTGAIM